MKIIFISILTIILSLNLFARENPFEPTDTFKEIQQQYITELEKQEIERQRIEDEEKKKIKENLVENKTILIDKEINKDNKIAEKEEQENEILEPSEYYDILPFINATTIGKRLIINVDNKYKLKNQDILHKNNKFVFDFVGSLNISTKRVNLNHQYFKSIIVGSHIEENFFRVVIVLSDKIGNYEENIINSDIMIEKVK